MIRKYKILYIVILYMNLVIGYFYGDKKMQLLNSGPKRDMIEFMESFCLDYVAKIQGNKVNRINDIKTSW